MATVNITNTLEGRLSFILPSNDYICSFTAIIIEANTTYESSVHVASGQPIPSMFISVSVYASIATRVDQSGNDLIFL